MAKQVFKSKAASPAKEKKQRKESLLLKYGIIAFLEILTFISVFFFLFRVI